VAFGGGVGVPVVAFGGGVGVPVVVFGGGVGVPGVAFGAGPGVEEEGAPAPVAGELAGEGGGAGGGGWAGAVAVDGAETSVRGCAFARVAKTDDVTSAHERSAYKRRRLCMG
jgi:hypothetical protein